MNCTRCLTEVTDERYVFCSEACIEAYFAPPIENIATFAKELEDMTIEGTRGGVRATRIRETAEAILREMHRYHYDDFDEAQGIYVRRESENLTDEGQPQVMVASKVTAIMQEVVDTPPWAYTYRERPDDLIEIRASELEAILRAHIEP